MVRALFLGMILSMSFFVVGGSPVQAQSCPGYCNQYPDRTSPSSQCSRGYTESSDFTCPGSFDSICCVQDAGTAGSTGGGGCSQAYDACTINGMSGYCARDDDDASGTLFCQPGTSPVTPGTGGGGFCEFQSGSSPVAGTCTATSACSSGGGPALNGSCISGQICCRTITTVGGTGTGGGGTTTTGGGGGSGSGCPSGFVGRGSVCFPATTGLSSTPIIIILMSAMNWLLAIFGILAIIAFVISGIQYLMAAGDEGMMETGKRNMQYSIIGVIIALAGLIIIRAIDTALRGFPFF